MRAGLALVCFCILRHAIFSSAEDNFALNSLEMQGSCCVDMVTLALFFSYNIIAADQITDSGELKSSSESVISLCSFALFGF
jgi:hypothetical protein